MIMSSTQSNYTDLVVVLIRLYKYQDINVEMSYLLFRCVKIHGENVELTYFVREDREYFLLGQLFELLQLLAIATERKMLSVG
jgi:hypothetical protein